MPATPIVEARGLVVQYGATVALNGVDLDVYPGEVHAVVGENGAGKSTLLRVVAGVTRPTSGVQLVRAGTRCTWVPQDVALPRDLRVADWIFLGRELHGPLGIVREREMVHAAGTALRAVGCAASATALVGSLPVTQRKQVQFARALSEAPDLLLLDEPTAVLGEAETAELFERVRALRQRGVAVLYVSHRLVEVLAIADRVTVLRDGRWISTDAVRDVDVDTLVQRMVGRDLLTPRHAERTPASVLLHLEDVATAHVHGLSLSVRRGEVVGLAGLVGAGRSEVLEAIAGLRRVRAGHIHRQTAPVFVPEDRNGKGLVPTLRLRENVFLPARNWLLHPAAERRDAQHWIERLAIRCTSTEAAIDSLSGGNQQKLLLARALQRQPQLLLLDEPTAGVDVGAKAEIHRLIGNLAAAEAAILLASSDLPELLALCDQIIALREGRPVGKLAARDASEQRLAALIMGAAA